MTVAKPNLFIVGAPKCGTTAWVNYLSDHPDIFFTPAKEPHYFSTDFPEFRWARTESEYSSLFEGAGNAAVVGEASVQYLYSREAASNIGACNPEARILVFLRRHESFLPSYHHQLVYNREEDVSDFATAWKLSLSASARKFPPTCRESSFLDYPSVGRFSEQLERYLDVFPEEQLMVVRFEHWTSSPRETYLRILNFLCLDDDGRQDFPPIHQAKHHRSNLLANITQRPPTWLLKAGAMIKWATGKKKLNAAAALRRVNTSDGYATTIDDDLKRELIEFFASENEALDKLLASRNLD